MSGSSPEHLLVSRSADSIPDVRRASNSPEWLDANRWAVFALIAAIPLFVTLPLWILRLSPDPIWFFSGVVQSVKAAPIPTGLPFGDPNVGWTSQALGHLAALQWIHGAVPWWNPYSGIGLPLAGEMQPGAFFLPFILLLLFHNGFIWLRIAIQLVAGFSTFALLRELKLGQLAALVGALAFELNGTFAWTPGPISVFCAAAFLPLILLGVEQISNRRRARMGTVWVALGIALSLLAGFPEVAYINGLLVLLWSVCRLATQQHRWQFALRVGWGGVLGVLLAAPLLVGFWSLSNESPGFQLHQWGHLSLALEALPTIFLPYAYGPFPAAQGSSILLVIWGNVGGYIGLVTFLLALVGFRSRNPLWLRALLIAWVALAWAKTFGLKPVMELMNHIPFLLQTAFYRYAAPSWELCLIILAAFAIEEWRYRKPALRLPLLIALVSLLWSIYLAWPARPVWGWDPAHEAKAAKHLACAAAWALAGLICAGILLRSSRTERKRWAIAAILVLDAAVFFTVPVLSSSRPGSIDTAGIHYLQTHLGLARFYSLGPIEPNYGAYFRLPSLNYDGFPVPRNFLKYTTHQLFPPLVKSTGQLFWPAWQPYGNDAGPHYLLKFLPNYEALGVRYVVSPASGADALRPRADVPTGSSNSLPLALQPNQQVRLTVPEPASPKESNGSIQAIDLFIGTYANTSDGALAVKICADGQCTQGKRRLSESSDNSFFSISLSPVLKAATGDKLKIIVTHEGGSNPVALWLWPDLPGRTQDLFGPNGKLIPDKAVRVAFSYGSDSANLSRVYHDSLVDVFELPHPAPYYSIADGGPCHLGARSRESVHAVCSAPAALVRRELYMPGWHASRDGKRIAAKPYDKIFQSYDLPAGDSRLQFAYVPPYAVIAAWGSLFAVVALLAEFVFDWRHRLRGRSKAHE